MPLPKDPIRGEETRRKMSVAKNGKKRPPYQIRLNRKMSDAHKGNTFQRKPKGENLRWTRNTLCLENAPQKRLGGK
jgi:hypothetical protein